jgi:hypothetical protein
MLLAVEPTIYLKRLDESGKGIDFRVVLGADGQPVPDDVRLIDEPVIRIRFTGTGGINTANELLPMIDKAIEKITSSIERPLQ